MTFTRTTVPDLNEGDVVATLGLIVHIDGPGRTFTGHAGRPAANFPGRILNAAELRDEDGKYRWPFSGLIVGERWNIQGNDLKHVERITYTPGEHVCLPGGRVALVTDLAHSTDGVITVSPLGDGPDVEWFHPWDLLPARPGQTHVLVSPAGDLLDNAVGTVAYVRERPETVAAHLMPVMVPGATEPAWVEHARLTVATDPNT